MASGGGWVSETYDNGRDFHKERAPHGRQESPLGSTTPADMYNPSAVGMNKDSSSFGVIALSLRIAQIVLTLIAFSIMAATKDTIYRAYTSYSYTFYDKESIKFSSVKAFVGVLSLNCIVCFYAAVQVVHSIVSVASKRSLLSSATKGFSMLTFLFDSVLAYGLVAAAAAGADSAAILADEDYCSVLPKFCQKAQASVAVSFLAFVVLAVSAALYPVRLLRLTK